MLEFQRTAEGACINLSGELSIFQANDVFEAFKPVLSEKQNTTVDLADLNSIDTSIIQILMFIKSYLKKHQAELNLINHSPAVLALMERLGLINWFNDPVFISPEKTETKNRGAKQ